MIPKQQGLQFVIFLFKCFYCYIGDNQGCICKGSLFCHLMTARVKPPIQGVFLEKQCLIISCHALPSITWFYQRNLHVETMWCVTCSALWSWKSLPYSPCSRSCTNICHIKRKLLRFLERVRWDQSEGYQVWNRWRGLLLCVCSFRERRKRFLCDYQHKNTFVVF